MSNSSQNCVIPRFIRYKKKKEITNRWIRDITIYIFARLIKRKRLSLAPLRPFHQRSNRVRALIWGGAISATDVTPFPGQSSFQRRGCVSYVIPEERRGHWTAPGVETLLTLLRQNAPSPPRIKWHELPSSACFSFPSLLFFPYFPPPFLLPLFVHKQLRTCSFLCILSSILFSLPFKPPNIPPSFYSVSFPFPSLRLLLSSSSRSPPRGVLYPLHFPSLSFSHLVRCVSTFLRSLRARDSFPTCEFPSCNIVYIIERIEEYAYLVFDMRGGTLEIASVQSFSPFLFFLSFVKYTRTQIIV